MAIKVYIATSLDGFIATPDGGLEWLEEIPNPDQDDFGYAEFMDGIDAIVMGRNTYEKVLSFGEWPYQKPVFALSHHTHSVPSHLKNKVTLKRGDIRTISRELQLEGFENLYIDGGQVIQQFLEADLVDEMIISRLPVLLGDGIPLFGRLTHPLKFQHIGTKVYNQSLVMSHYKRAEMI